MIFLVQLSIICIVQFLVDGSPCHIGAVGLQTKILEELFGEDIHAGDCFINTCSYFGNHNGDFTIFAPDFIRENVFSIP